MATPPKECAAHSIDKHRWFPALVWIFRIVVGATFVMSGFVKGIDLYGFVFKIEEYLAVWGMSQPRSIAVMGALVISSYEFVFGLLLLMGCYKRLATWALSASMLVWLPLTFYIWIASPVADCGCFGDFLVLSNFATFVKNLILSAMLIFLLKYNPLVKQSLYQPAIQWIVGALITLYIIIIALYGYNVQPMLDFRPYPIGSLLAQDEDATADSNEAQDEDEDEDANLTFIYIKDGVRQEFTIDNLPDSTWQFLERVDTHSLSDKDNLNQLTVYDVDGEEVTDDAILSDGSEILLVIPEANRFDITYSSFLNDVEQWAAERHIPMVCLIGGDADEIATWQDLSMASYPIYSAEDTKLKELSRGTMSLVILSDGIVESKFTVGSIGGVLLDKGPQGEDFLTRITPHPGRWLKTLTLAFGALLLLIFLFQSLILAVSRWIKRKYQKKSVNLQSVTKSDFSREDKRP